MAQSLKTYTDADQAVARIEEIFAGSAAAVRSAFAALTRPEGPKLSAAGANYPYVGLQVGLSDLRIDARLSYGALLDPGVYGTTLTRPDLFADYYREQIGLLMRHHKVPVVVGISDRPIPLPFIVEDSTADITEAQLAAMQELFALPDLSATDDSIANGTRHTPPGRPKPLALFEAERVDYSLHRLAHYTAT
ncbi:MAG: AMP nucleosidase, partial [Rhodospirillaceae bacterium]|nr:AMP nucleosidase [Rhodospirillaceae bacterium]